MQNAPTMLGQKMMNRQIPYGPIGMVSQDMSGNKKGARGGGGGGGAIGLAFDTATATAGVTFSNGDTTATNGSGSSTASAKANAAVIPLTGNNWYWEFIIGGAVQQLMGFGLPSFTCNTANQIGLVTSSVGYLANNGQVWANGGVRTSIATSSIGDVIGFKLQVFNPGSLLTILKNGVEILSSFNTSVWIADNSVAWTPVFSSNSTSAISTISNNVYSYAGYTPIGTAATRITASASVPAVADGAYDVYTFNASGTFTAGSTGAVRALVIAGGGASSATGSAGAGAGGYLEKASTVTPQTYTITVGAGGAPLSGNGITSAFNGITTVGGGGSPNNNTGANGSTGGSGSGGSINVNIDDSLSTGGAGTSGQGYAGGGGKANSVTGNYGGGGGGGAGGVGGTHVYLSPTYGGIGLYSDITGTSIGRGGGGAPQSNASTYASEGGGTQYSDPSPNTGGGAGGQRGGNGGSGVVIIRVRARA